MRSTASPGGSYTGGSSPASSATTTVSTSTSSAIGVLSVMVMIFSGTLNTLISKMQYGLRSQGTELCVDPNDPTQTTTLCPFEKPWFSALLAKMGMSLSLVYLCMRHRWNHAKRRHRAAAAAPHEPIELHFQPREQTTLLTGHQDNDQYQYQYQYPEQEQEARATFTTLCAIAWPSFLDLVQTLLSNVGLLYVSSSVYQMARGSVIIFSAFVSVHVLHKKLVAYHYTSIWIVALAVALVGWAGTSSSSPPSTATTTATTPESSSSFSSSNALLGLMLIVMAQFLTAVQIVSEEYIMTSLHVHPLLLVGVEGFWGLLFYVILIPLLTTSSSSSTSAIAKIWHEDFYDSMVKISTSNLQFLLCLLNICAVAMLGPSANYVTKHLSGVMRSIAEVLRTLGVWLACLFVFYVVDWRDNSSPGEAWTTKSWIELVGFVLMVYGTLAFKKIIRLPWVELYTVEAPTKPRYTWVEQQPIAASA